jgi:MFS family permease
LIVKPKLLDNQRRKDESLSFTTRLRRHSYSPVRQGIGNEISKPSRASAHQHPPSTTAHKAAATFFIKINIYGLGLMAFWNTLNTIILPMRVSDTTPKTIEGTALGLVSLIGIGTAALVQPIAGRANDFSALPNRRSIFIVAGTLLGLPWLVMVGWARVFALLLLGYVLLQISINVGQAAFQALIPDLVSERQTGLASGVKNALTVAGAAIGLLGIGLLRAAGAPTAVWLGYLGLILGLTAVSTLKWVPATSSKADQTDPHAASAFDVKALARSMRAILRKHRKFRLAVYAQFLFLLGTYPAQRFLLYFLRDRFGDDAVSKASIGLLAAIVVAAVSAAVAGELSDHLGRVAMLVGSVIVGTLGIVGLGFAESLPLTVASGCFVAVGVGAFQAANWALMADDLPNDQSATSYGIANIATAGAGAIAGIFGPFVDLLHARLPGGTWQITFGLAGLVAISALLPIRKVRVDRGVSAS